MESIQQSETNPNGFFANTDDVSSSVKVAVRIRPMVGKEIREGNQKKCIEATPEISKLQIGTKEFNFDRVFDDSNTQLDLFDVCGRNLVLGCFAGYNATILAYGQTGSGKTHTMGTGSTVGLAQDQVGIVPRVFEYIFEELENRQRQSEFNQFEVKVQFLELYGEDLHDLLDLGPVDKITGQQMKQLQIREEKGGAIRVDGLKSQLVASKHECVQLLNQGIMHRVTSATLMNEGSSRSHAIFTIIIDQKIVKQLESTEGEDPTTSEERISSKFHFVDLAGSERIKKTGATGKLMQEGISINKGLSALGNVISALTDERKSDKHVPYRDSKLTRILQDSLGGNSLTVMVACVSPSDSNYDESLSTIKYASRARNIKNKPVVNRDANSMLIEALRGQIQTLQAECKEYQKILQSNNIPIPLDFSAKVQSRPQQQSPTKQVDQQSQQISNKEVQELKLKLARAERSLKELQSNNQEVSAKQTINSNAMNELQNDRDEMVLRLEAITEHLKQNEIVLPKELTNRVERKSNQLLDDYKAKVAKLTEDMNAKNAELATKTKKITELQTQMKRDETVLKNAIAENSKLKRGDGNRNQIAPPLSKIETVLDADELKQKFMDSIGSKIEAIFDDAKDQDAEKVVDDITQATLEGKDKILAAVKQNMSQMKLDLDDLFKNSMAGRIQEIQKSIQAVEADRRKAPAPGDAKIALQQDKERQKKIDELNKQLEGEQREKHRLEQSIQKTMVMQEARLKAMEQELQKLRKEKEDGEAQRKYGEERFLKFKTTATKDVVAIKKAAAEKDKTVNKLKNDLKKTDQLVVQKMAELKAIQKRAREEREKRIAEEERENERNGVDIDSIKDWIKQQTDALLNQQELSGFLKKQRQALKEVEDEMLAEGDRLTEISIQKERLELERDQLQQSDSDEARLLEIEAELEDIQMEQDSITSTLDTLDEHQQYLLNKVNKLTEEINSIDLESIQPPRFRGLSSVENARTTLKTFFMVMLDLNVYKRELENKCIEQDETILEMNNTITLLSERAGISAQQREALVQKQKVITKVISNLGDGVDFMDNREVGELGLSKKEEDQLTKMSLSKIVGNLRNKLKEEEKKSQVLNLKIDQLIKEKELVKQKLAQTEREKKMSNSFVAQAKPEPKPKPVPKVKQQKPQEREENIQANVGRRLSFKQRRDIVKEHSQDRDEQNALTLQNVESLFKQPTKSVQPASLHERRKNRASAGEQPQLTLDQIQQLENEMKSKHLNLTEDQRELRRKAYQESMQAFTIPETHEDEEYESSEQYDLEETKDDELTDEMAARQEAQELLMMQQKNQEQVSAQHSWRLQDFKQILLSKAQRLVDCDSVQNRLFLMLSDLTLIELDLITKEIKNSVKLSEVEGATDIGDRATSFVLQKDLNMLAVSTGHAVVMFDFESDLRYINTIKVEGVLFLAFVDVQIVIMTESEDGSEVTLSCYSDSGIKEKSITVKQFMGNQIILRSAEESIIFACGNLIGKVSVPEMELQYQEDSGHKGAILDIVVTETCIFTTGADQSLRVFDSENGMLLLEPMEEMECDRLAKQGFNIVARCGQGAALIVFKFQDGDEELTEVDFIDLAGEEEQKQQTVAFAGGHKVSSAAGEEFSMILYAQVDKQSRLNIRTLKNRSYIT